MKAAIGAVLLGTLAATPTSAQLLGNPDSDFVDTTSKETWHAVVEKTDRGWLIGNPEADTKLIMFTSYGCEGCYDFAFKGDPELDIALLAPGLLSLEIRPRFHHPVDLPLTLLAGCGEAERFKVNHAIFMRDQARWKERWGMASGFNRANWSRQGPQARNSLVSAFDFGDILADRRGYSRMDLNRCLSDRQEIARLRANAEADNTEFDLPTDAEGYSRPHFVLNGEKLDGVNDWDGLYGIFSVSFRPDIEGEQP